MDFGKMIKDRRLELGLTLEQVGNIVGVGKSTVRKWEAGTIRNLRKDKIVLLARALRLSPIDLIDLENQPEDKSLDLSPEEVIVILAYRAADDRARADALHTLESHPRG